ncbi:hypothetical protein [Oceaniferula spumae]|uniref:hypothetical protein n=1 Tax=Oceaniferula spumae TaxID=2979115 RepID=UPI003F4EE958
MLKILALFVVSLLLCSCGGITHYQHDEVPAKSGAKLSPVTINVGQRVRILKHTRGLMWGGYIETVAVENTSIAIATRGNGTAADQSSPNVYLTGLKPGITRAAYCNELGSFSFEPEHLTPSMHRRIFEIRVQDPGYATPRSE